MLASNVPTSVPTTSTSVDSVSNFVFRDRLSELNLQSYWDRYRGYFFVVTVATAIGMVYILQAGITLDCLPHTNDTESLDGYFDATESFVESFCLSYAYNYIGWSAVGALYFCGVILFYSKRLHHQGIVGPLESYVRVRSAIEKLQLTSEQLQVLSISSCRDVENKKEILEVRKACEPLWNLDEINLLSLRKKYRGRNGFLLYMLLVIGVYSTWIVTSSYQYSQVICLVSREDVPAIPYQEYDCVWKLPNIMFALCIAFTIGIVGQIYWVYVALRKSWNSYANERKGITGQPYLREKLFDFLYFGNALWNNSSGSRSNFFGEFCSFIDKEAPQCIADNFFKYPDSIDIYLIEVYIKLSTYSSRPIIPRMIYQLIKTSDFKCESKEYKRLVKAVENITVFVWSEKLEVLLNYVYDKKYFELFITFLEIAYLEVCLDCTNYLRHLQPNLDSIGQPYETGGSLLYYAIATISRPTFQYAVGRILKATDDERQLFIHYNGNSMTVEKNEDDMQVDPNRLKFILDVLNERVQTRETFTSQVSSKTTPIRETVEHSLEDINRIAHNSARRSWGEVAEELSHFKFSPWTQEINEFAQKICRLRQWEVLVALMSAFIISEDVVNDEITDRVIPNCNLNLLEAVNPAREAEDSQHQNSLLYFALTKRDYAPFSLTAAATILHLTREQRVKKVRGKSGTEFFYDDPQDFVEQRSNVPLHKHVKLVALLRDIVPHL